MPAPADSLFEEAVTHAVRLQANPQSPAALAALASWRARSPAHEGAWAEIAEIHGMTGTLLAPVPPRGIGRRKVLGFGLLGLGLGGSAAIFGSGMVMAARADHLTTTGQILDLVLADGSRVSLGPDSAIALDFADGGRGLVLLAGMLWCRIAPGPQAFRLHCAGARITSADGELSLSEENGLISLALDRGAARLETLPGAGPGDRQQLVAGDWLELSAGGTVLRRVELGADLASGWRQGRISVQAEPLAVVVRRIARWLPGRVVIADPGLGDKLVSGVFDMQQPRDALLAAVSPHGAGLRQVSPWLLVVTAY